MTAAPENIQLSCRLEMLPGDRVRDQLQAAHRFGFDGITLPGRFRDRWLTQLRDCFKDRPLPMVSISLGFENSLLSPNESERQICRDSLLRSFDLCAEFGATLFNLPPCLIQDNPVRIRDAASFSSVRERLDSLLLEQLPALGDEARQRGVELLIEPVNHYESDYLNSIQHAVDLCQKLNHPAIGFTADFFHMQIEELRMGDAIGGTGPAANGGKLRHVHVAENTRVEPGPGSLDFKPGFRALKAIGYQGWIEVECRQLSGTAAEVLPKSVDYLMGTWKDA